MDDRLNFFTPFHRLEPNHENQLTRALLVVLRYSPMAHAVWLRHVLPDRELHELPRPSFATQQRAVRSATERDPEAALVSVYLSPEAPLTGDEIVVESERGQVLDAIVDYGGELLVVVENKVADADARQALNINTSGSYVRVAHGQPLVVVRWRDLLVDFMALRDPELQLVSAAEGLLLDDFLFYVEDYFPSLGPYGSLDICHGNAWRIGRRLRQILVDVAEAEAIRNSYGHYVRLDADLVAQVYVRFEQQGGPWIELSVFPGDTLTQARAFYARPAVVEAVLGRRDEPGWHVQPNFHFGYQASGLCWTFGDITLDDYVALWQQRINSGEGMIWRDDWKAHWDELADLKVVNPDDWSQFETQFVNTARESATPRPGLWAVRRWSLREAEVLDASGQFAGEVSKALAAALAACDASVNHSAAAVA
jgi:hypothetical protein